MSFFLQVGKLEIERVTTMKVNQFFEKLAKLREQQRVERHIRKGEVVPFEFNGQSFFLNPDRAACYHVLNSTAKLQRMADLAVSDAKTCFDVGANCGLFSALIGQKIPGIGLHAFEPSVDLPDLIRRNCDGLDLSLVPKAVGDQEGTEIFYVNPDSQQTNSCNYEAVALVSGKAEIEKREVELTTLDVYAKQQEITELDILKVDVQGYEGPVFRGAKSLLPNTSQIFVESTWMDIESILNVIPMARQYGFEYLSVISPVFMGVDLLLDRDEPGDPSKVESTYRLSQLDGLDSWL
ncbi:FkbM family methyltransferase [Akkermansiaceae bacterium]|nr:FkbM family methyltransferase [Akkermansiaceae bacterium]